LRIGQRTKGKFKPLDFLIACDGRYSGDQLQSSFNGWQASRQALEGDPAAYTDHGNLDLLSKGAPTTVFPECDKGKLVHAVPLYTHPACVDVPEEWKLVPRLSTESMELAARDWGIPNITPDEAGEVWDAMVEAIPEPPKITDAVASVPKGWTIEPFDDGFGVEGISVLWPDKRGGVHLRANDPKTALRKICFMILPRRCFVGHTLPVLMFRMPSTSEPCKTLATSSRPMPTLSRITALCAG